MRACVRACEDVCSNSHINHSPGNDRKINAKTQETANVMMSQRDSVRRKVRITLYLICTDSVAVINTIEVEFGNKLMQLSAVAVVQISRAKK